MRMYKTEGIILCFFFIALRCPLGVLRKQLEAMLSIWHIENTIAKVFTSNPENTNTKVMIHDIANPTIEHAKKPITRCWRVSLGQSESYDEDGSENIESFVGYAPVSSFPMLKTLDCLNYIQIIFETPQIIKYSTNANNKHHALNDRG